MTWDKGAVCEYDKSLVEEFKLDSAGAILLSIKDSGVGMSVENLEQLFQEGMLVCVFRMIVRYLCTICSLYIIYLYRCSI